MALETTYFLPTIVIMLLVISGVYVAMKKWVNGLFFFGAGVYLGLGEFVSIALTGETISANHWMIDVNHPAIGLLLTILLGALFLLLVTHLGKHTIKRMMEKK